MRATHFSRDTRALLDEALRAQVRFLVVGGEAVILYGYSRLTGDVDLFYDRSPDNVQALYQALLSFWQGDIPGIASPAELAEPGIVVQFGRPPNRVDLLSELGPVEFPLAWSRRLEVPISGLANAKTLPYIGFADLIAAKRAAGRAKDLDDIEQLTAGRSDRAP